MKSVCKKSTFSCTFVFSLNWFGKVELTVLIYILYSKDFEVAAEDSIEANIAAASQAQQVQRYRDAIT